MIAARRRWAAALGVSVAVHGLLIGAMRFVPGPPNLAVDEIVVPIAVLRIEHAPRRRLATGTASAPAAARPQRVVRGHTGPAPAAPARALARIGTEAAPAPHSRAVPRPARHDGSGSAPLPGPAASETPGPSSSPEAAPALTAEMLAKLNARAHDAIPSAMPQTMRRYDVDIAAVRVPPDLHRVTAANYPLPERGLFAHALVARTAHEAIAVRAIRRIGRGYICIGYLAKVPDHSEPIAGPYIGACKRDWLAQLGLTPSVPAPLPSAAPSPSPHGSDR